MKTLLELQNVSKIFQLDGVEVKALKNVSLKIREGEFVAIMGPSGSGKSTLMHLAGCLDTPTAGKIILEGRDVSRLSERELAKIRNQKIGFIFQTFNLLPRVTAVANVELPLIYTGVKKQEREKKSREILNRLGLKERMEHFPNQLSGGEQQRVAIARALVTKPSIILADEPTGNVDSKTGAEIMKIIENLNKEGNTIAIITHDRQIANYADRLIEIRDGEIKEE